MRTHMSACRDDPYLPESVAPFPGARVASVRTSQPAMPLVFPATPPLPLCPAARRATAAVASAARSSSSSSSSASFDAAAFEAERLRLDAAARAGMESTARAAAAEANPRAWKWAIRKRVWDALEAEGVARDPRPVHHRIPNFDGAPAAADAVRAVALALSPARSAPSDQPRANRS